MAETVEILVEDEVENEILTGEVTGRSIANSPRQSERGEKLFVLASGVEYQCWREGEPPYKATRSKIQPCR